MSEGYVITGRMTCRECGSPGFHYETCSAWPGRKLEEKAELPEEGEPGNDKRESKGDAA